MSKASEDGTSTHLRYLQQALDLARKSPPKPTNYCVGAVLVDAATDTVLSTGYTLELPGNTHAEQCCFSKLCASTGIPEENVGKALPADGRVTLYTTMEPCVERLSGNLPCVDRILRSKSGAQRGVDTVVVGVSEPDTFVKGNSARQRLKDAGIDYIHIAGLEEDILAVATAGHAKD